MARGYQLDFPIGIPIGDKFKLLRGKENLSQKQFCDLVGINKSALAMVESGSSKSMTSDNLIKIINHHRFFPYAMWLLCDELTEDQAQQISDFLKSVREKE